MRWLLVIVAAGLLGADDAEDRAVRAIRVLRGKLTRAEADGAVVQVTLTGPAVTDASLKDLPGLQQLQALDLIKTAVSDAGLKEIARCPELQTLNLRNTAVTDAGLKELA